MPPTYVFPAFYLKAFNDKLRWSNIDTGVWLSVDLATTLTGVGNLLKLRHLRHLAKLKKVTTLFKVKTAVSIIEVTTGTLNALLTLADSDSEFAVKLQQYLFWLEIASLGTDVVVEKLLRKSAREALNAVDDLPDKIKNSDQLKQTTTHLESIDDTWKYFDRVGASLKTYKNTKTLEKVYVTGSKAEFEKGVRY